jgi:hypothetical protein
MSITERVNTYKTKYEYGFIKAEIETLLKEYPIDIERFNLSMMGHTCMLIDNETIWYHCDIIKAIKYSIRMYK